MWSEDTSNDQKYERLGAKGADFNNDDNGRVEPISLSSPRYRYSITITEFPFALKKGKGSGLLWYECRNCRTLFPVWTQRRRRGENAFHSPECLKKHRQFLFSGKPQSDERRQLQSEIMKRKFKDQEFRTRMREIHQDPTLNERRSKAHKIRWKSRKRTRTNIDDKLEAFYQSPEWKKKTKEIMKRNKFQCQACGYSRKDTKLLGVHHIYSLRKWISEGKDPNDYPDKWLATICPHCHPPTDNQKGLLKYPRKSKKPRHPTK